LLEGGERRPMPVAGALGRGGDLGWVVRIRLGCENDGREGECCGRWSVWAR
jgi:hypothetical protein